jgi:hypothetical protein
VARKIGCSGETFGEAHPWKVTVAVTFQLQADVHTKGIEIFDSNAAFSSSSLFKKGLNNSFEPAN